MHFSKIRTLTLGVITAAIALAFAVPAMAHTSTAKGTTITVTAGKPSEFKFQLSSSSAMHGAITFKVTNKGALPHDFKLCTTAGNTSALTCTGKGTAVISGGASATLTVSVAKAGSYEYLCDVPGHAAAGMKGVLKVS